MARKPQIYRRLPGRPFAPFCLRSLWQGPDHLLWVNTVFYNESYKRFYYKDIQSLVIRRSDVHQFWNIIWGALMAIFGLVAWFVSGTPYVSGTFAAFFLFLMLMNIALGPACKVYLQTAVQVVSLGSLKRVRTARRAIDQIKDLVESVQGPLEMNKKVKTPVAEGPSSGLPSAVAEQSPAMAASETASPGPYKPMLHGILFATLAALGVLETFQLMLHSLPVAALGTLLHAIAQVVVIMALVRWYRHLKATLIIKLNWLALVLVTLQTLLGQGLYMVVSVRHPELTYNAWAMLKKMFELYTSDHLLALAANLAYAAFSLMLGAFGFMALRRRPDALTASEKDLEILKK